MTPERLQDPSRAAKALQALSNLRTVAGNHERFLYDFSPSITVWRYGGAQITSQAIHLCRDENVSVQWISGGGRVLGTL